MGFRPDLLRIAIEEINAAEPDLIVVAGDITDDGYGDHLPRRCSHLSKTQSHVRRLQEK